MTEEQMKKQFGHLTDDNPLWEALEQLLLENARNLYSQSAAAGLSCCDRALLVGGSDALTQTVEVLNAMRK